MGTDSVPGLKLLRTTRSGFGLYRAGDGRDSYTPRPVQRRTARPAAPKPGDDGRVWASPEAAFGAIGKRERGRLAGRWIYQHADGSEAFIVGRFNLPGGEKTYRPIHRTAAGYVEGDPPGKLPLYNLPEVLASTGRVYVCEGEKCAEALRSIGLVATTSAHGCKAADKTDGRPLAGRECILLPDNDEAGRAYARGVARLVSALNPPARVKLLDVRKLWPELPEGGDIADYVAFRDSVEADDLRRGLDELADRTPFVETKRAGAVLVRLANVRPEPVTWLWPGRIPLSKLTMMIGDPEVGKSYMTLDLAARVSTARPWPDASGVANPPGNVILVSAEDGLADTIRLRLDLLGADPSRVTALTAVRRSDSEGEAAFSLELDLLALEQAIVECKPRLLILDPVAAFLGQIDSHVNAAVRGLLAPLSEVAARLRVAVVAVTHLTKLGGNARALYRAMGSLAFVAAARAVWFVGRDPSDPERRLLLPVKMNLAARPNGLAFRIDDNGLTWEAGEVALTADDLLGQQTGIGTEDAGELAEACAFLSEALAGDPVPVRQLQKSANDAGLAWRTVRRAKREMRILAERYGGLGGKGHWRWGLAGSELR